MKLGKRKTDTESAAPKAPKPPKAPKAPKSAKAPKPPKAGGGKKGRFVLIIGDDGGILVYMQGATVVRRLFAPSPQPDHTASIVDLMRAHPGTPLYILADVLDQQYIRHAFPPVSSLSVKGLVQRRLDRDFQAEDLTGAFPLGRDKTGRKEWNFLLISLANTPLMQQWMELLIELPNEFKGIYLVPVEVQNYIRDLKKQVGGAALPWQLLVTHNKVSGFRQVVLKDGKLVFTRVTQAIDDEVSAVLAGNIEQEIINTLEYLRRLGFTDNATIDMMVVTSQEVKDALDIKRFKAGGSFVLTPLEVADMLGQQQSALSADRFGDVVMSVWFGTTKKRLLKLNTAYAEKLAKFYAARRGLIIVAILGVLALIGMSVMNVMASMTDNAEAENIDNQRRGMQGEIATVKQSLEGTDKSVALKSAIVSTYDVYMKDAHVPAEFVDSFAPAIPSGMRVSKMTWKDTAAVTADAGTPATPAADGAAAAGPIKIEVDMSFTENYPDVEALTEAANEKLLQIKKAMPRYDMSVEAYPWLTKSNDKVEITIGNEVVGSLSNDEKQITITFTGPKPENNANPSAGAPVGMADPGMP